MINTIRLIIFIGMFISQITHAKSFVEDIRVVTGVSLGYSTFSFPEKLDHDISFPSINIPIAITSNGWQLSANFQTTMQDADISEEEDLGNASRNDLDFTLGYQLSTNWTLFAGYKYGKTDMQFTPRDSGEDEQQQVLNESYRHQGPFVGFNYSWRFEKAGSLSLSLAYAKLNATNIFAANTDEGEEEEEQIEFDDITGRVTGNTKGFSYAINWTIPISSNLLFQTRFKINDYQQDITLDDLTFDDIDVDFTTLHVGVAYVF